MGGAIPAKQGLQSSAASLVSVSRNLPAGHGVLFLLLQ